MKLIEAYNLLAADGVADNHRYFAELYKLYNFADDQPLRDYLDFIEHEPVHWMRGFPAKLVNRLGFAKPKTAVIKLLKKPAVAEALGADYVARIHDLIWNTFKREADAILQERSTKVAASRANIQVIQEGKEDKECNEGDDVEEMSVGSVESAESFVFGQEPTPPLRPLITMVPSVSSSTFGGITETTDTTNTSCKQTKNDYEDRVEFLKSVLFKMSQTLPDGVADAFRLLVSHV